MVDWVQILFEFLAVVVGVSLAFLADRYHEEQLDKTRAREFLEIVRDELQENVVTLDGVLKQMQDETRFNAPYYRLRTFAWTSLSSRIALIRNGRLRGDIIRAYYKFDMYERTMSRYLDLVYTIIRDRRPQQDELYQKAAEIRKAIAGQIRHPDREEEGMEFFTPAVVREIDEEIKRLQDC